MNSPGSLISLEAASTSQDDGTLAVFPHKMFENSNSTTEFLLHQALIIHRKETGTLQETVHELQSRLSDATSQLAQTKQTVRAKESVILNLTRENTTLSETVRQLNALLVEFRRKNSGVSTESFLSQNCMNQSIGGDDALELGSDLSNGPATSAGDNANQSHRGRVAPAEKLSESGIFRKDAADRFVDLHRGSSDSIKQEITESTERSVEFSQSEGIQPSSNTCDQHLSIPEPNSVDNVFDAIPATSFMRDSHNTVRPGTSHQNQQLSVNAKNDHINSKQSHQPIEFEQFAVNSTPNSQHLEFLGGNSTDSINPNRGDFIEDCQINMDTEPSVRDFSMNQNRLEAASGSNSDHSARADDLGSYCEVVKDTNCHFESMVTRGPIAHDNSLFDLSPDDRSTHDPQMVRANKLINPIPSDLIQAATTDFADGGGRIVYEGANVYNDLGGNALADKETLCNICGRSFLGNDNFRNHKCRHHDYSRPYKCAYCPKSFSHSSVLDSHTIALHTHQFPYHCPYCGKGYIRPVLLKKHMKTAHRADEPRMPPKRRSVEQQLRKGVGVQPSPSRYQ